MKRISTVLFIALAVMSLTACGKDKVAEAYAQGQQQQGSAFTVNGNAELDESKASANLGVAASEKLDSKKKSGNSGQVTEAAAEGGANGTGQTQDYVINTDTLHVHLRTCDLVDMQVPTFRTFKGTLDEAQAQGYSPCQMCLGR